MPGFLLIEDEKVLIIGCCIENIHVVGLSLKNSNFTREHYSMVKEGVLSDTYGFLDTRLLEFFKDRDEIWHAGDIGSLNLFKLLFFQGFVRKLELGYKPT